MCSSSVTRWFPNPRGGKPAAIEQRLDELHRLAAERGRPQVPVSIFGASPSPADLERYAELEVGRCVFSLPSASPDEVLTELDRLAELVPRWGDAAA